MRPPPECHGSVSSAQVREALEQQLGLEAGSLHSQRKEIKTMVMSIVREKESQTQEGHGKGAE